MAGKISKNRHFREPHSHLKPPRQRFPSNIRISLITRDSIYAIARICHANSVRLFVRPSVTRVYCIKMAERIIEILSPSDRPIILVFRHQGSLRKSQGVTPSGGAKYKGGNDFRPINRRISETVQDRTKVAIDH